MTMFEFMMNALYGLAGVVCIALALMVIGGVIVSVINAIARARRTMNGGTGNGKRKL